MNYINLDKVCLGCNRKCSKELKDYVSCILYRGKIETLEKFKPRDINYDDELKNIEDIKDMIRFYILWFLDDSNCNIALTQASELNEAIEKILKELTNVSKLNIILQEYKVNQFLEKS